MTSPNSRFWNIAAEISEQIEADRADFAAIEGAHDFHGRLVRIESMLEFLLWLHMQTLKELAARDGEDVTRPPRKIEVAGAMPS